MLRRLATTVLGLALAATAGCVTVGDVDAKVAKEAGYLDERDNVQIVTALLGGKNVFIPSTVVLSEGSGRRLSIYNTTDTPHGFQIPSLGVTAVLQPGQENVVALPPLEGGRIYNMVCHLHPPHRHATLMVVRGR